MINIAVTGSNGLIGSRFMHLLKKDCNFHELSSAKGFDITDINQISGFISKANPDIVVHFAAKTDVDVCEEDKKNDFDRLVELGILDNGGINIRNINPQDWKNNPSAFSVNAAGVKNLADICLKNKTKLIYASTDFVFSGKKDYYNEEDVPDPINWYGQTKFWGEKAVSEILENFNVARLSFPYGFKNPVKSDFVWKIYELLKSGKQISLIEDQIITPTFIDDIVLGIKFLIDKNLSGLYHLTGSSFITPHNAGKLIAQEFLAKDIQITGIKSSDYYKGKARRGFKLRIKNDKITKLGFKTKTFEDGIGLIKESL